MTDKKVLSKDDWKELIRSSLSPEEFQDLCHDLIKSNGFINVIERGKGGDGGRDLEAEFRYSIAGKEEKVDKCWFQCKRLKAGLNFKDISTEIQKAEDQRIRRFFILSTSDTTPACKDDIANWNSRHICEVFDWSGTKFVEILTETPNVCSKYLNEEIPIILTKDNPQPIIDMSSDIGKRYGIKINFNISQKVDLSNPNEVADIVKESLLNLKDVDINIKSLIYQKSSMFFHALDRNEDAILFLDKALEITPKNPDTLLTKGYILERIDEVIESNKCYDKILKIENNKFAYNNKSHNLMRQGKYKNALELINHALKIDKDFIMAIYNKAEILKNLNRSKEAIIFLDDNEELLKKSIGLKSTKIGLFIDILDLKQAMKLNEEILQSNPESIDALNNKGVIYEKNSRYEKKEKYLPLALEWFEKVTATDNKFPIGWSNQGVVYLNLGNVEKAKEILDTAMELFPKNPDILNKIGVLYINSTPGTAIKYFDKALHLRFEKEFLLNKAKALLTLGRWSDVIQACTTLLEYNSENSEAWYNKGAALYRMHQTARATLCLKNAEKYVQKPISLLEEENHERQSSF